MSTKICVMGESGSGKTTSLRTLNPASTFYIDCDKKGLSWRGWREQYNEQNKNYFATLSINTIATLLDKLNKEYPHIKTIVIDTLNTCMVNKEIVSMQDKGYDKWVDLAQCVWNLVEKAGTLRDDLTVIFIMHSETVRDDLGYTFTRIRTNGRKLEKIVLESLFNVVLLAKCKSDGKYVFETKANNSTAKTPYGAFENSEIENDMANVLKVLEEF